MKNPVKWGTISVVIYCIFSFLIPVDIYSSMLYLIASIGAAAFTFSLVKFLASIFLKNLTSAINDISLPDAERDAAIAKAYNPSGCVIMPVVLLIFFSIGTLLIWHETNMEKSELVKYGRITEAVVKNGNSISSRKFDFSNVILGFKKLNGDSVFIKHAIQKKQFDGLYQDQTVSIIYSERYPSILEIIYSQQQMDKYLKNGKKISR